MNVFKLQFGCLIIILYIVFVYIKQTLHKKISCRWTFDVMLVLCPMAVFFDGLTAWTVNHMDVVPYLWNLVAHGFFYLSMDLTIIVAFLYMVDLTIGLPKNKKAYLSLCAPGIISLIIIIAFLTKTEYIHGKTTYYSWGISAFACYISLVVHFTMILSLLIKKRRTLEKHKWLTTFSFILIMSLLLMVQVIWPETLITSLFPTVLIFGLYVNEEDPYFRRLQVYNETMVTDFATLVESRDNSTGGHINRTKMYVAIILHEMKKSTVYKNYMTKDYVKNVLNAAPLHDLGKISTPDHILQKPGKLEPEEFDIMKEHAKKGGEIILETFADLDDEDFQKIAYEVARFHHEKWDGKGYPEGLSGEDIPLHARIMAIADVFDAVSEKRCYRDAMPIDKCFQVIEEGKGTHFDPKLAELFLNAKESVLKIYRKQV